MKKQTMHLKTTFEEGKREFAPCEKVRVINKNVKGNRVCIKVHVGSNFALFFSIKETPTKYIMNKNRHKRRKHS